jgi:biopolymer transport protein ExbD
MPKVKMPKSSPSLDMTPMVDLAFLLVTFFMLTSSFKAPEPVMVDPPASTTEAEIPKQVFLVAIDPSGRVFVDITNNAVKTQVLTKLLATKKLGLEGQDLNKLVGAGPLGMSIKQFPEYAALESSERESFNQSVRGIPYDTTSDVAKIKASELYLWAYHARLEAHNDFNAREAEAKKRNLDFDKSQYMQFAIKADFDVPYTLVEKVINVFRQAQVKQFQMITDLEDTPEI